MLRSHPQGGWLSLHSIPERLQQMKAIRILHIDSSIVWRGGQNQIRILLDGLDPQHIRSYLAIPREAAHRHRFENCRHYPMRLRRFHQISAAIQLNRLCRKEGIELVHAHSSGAHNIGALMKIFGSPLPLLVHRRVMPPPSGNPFSTYKYSQRVSHHFITVSGAVRSQLIGSGVPAEDISVIHSAVETAALPSREQKKEASRSIRKKFEIPPDTPLIGFCGALTPEKGCHILLEAFAHLAQELPQARLLIAGTGSAKPQLTASIVNSPLHRRIRFTGFLQDTEAFLRGIDVLVFPSLSEGLGTTLLQAAWQYCPVIASNTGGIPEIITDQKSGILVPPGNPQALAAAITALLKGGRRMSHRLAGRLLEQARSAFNPELLCAAHTRLYRRLTGRSTTSS